MFGDKLEPEEMEKLIADFHTTQWRLLCPHGRPNHIFLPFNQLDQQFHR
jgi:DNA mismatch repair ATPase MutL